MAACRVFHDPFQHPTLQRGSRYVHASCTAGKEEKVPNCLLGSKLSHQDKTLVGGGGEKQVDILMLQSSMTQPCANICYD